MSIREAIERAGPRPENDAPQAAKKNFAERLSNEVAIALAAELRAKGFDAFGSCYPEPAGGGREKQYPGGLGAKKVDVSFGNDTAGLLMGISVKSINFADATTGNYRKNLTNRRGDMMFEATTLHMRFPYAVLGGLILLHDGANRDVNARGGGRTTFQRTHFIYRQFNLRSSHTDAPEKFEHIAVALYGEAGVSLYALGDEINTITLDEFLNRMGTTLAERNPDHFEFLDGRLIRA